MRVDQLTITLMLWCVGNAIADAGEAVFVSPYLPANASYARDASRVSIDCPECPTPPTMHAGFITLDAATNTNTYFVYCDALDGNASAPLLIWLQGGPGASSLFGMFVEIGPIVIDASLNATPRDVTWNEHYRLLFFDNPVGTGFSFTESSDKFATSEKQIGSDLLEALRQFYELFPSLLDVDLFVTGESYAGKYVPALASAILEAQTENETTTIPLRGIAIGDGAFDPMSQFSGFADTLYALGLFDADDRVKGKKYEKEWAKRMRLNDTVGAFDVFDEYLNGDFFEFPTFYANQTGLATNYFNFEQPPDGSSLTGDAFIDYLQSDDGRAAFHVGDRAYAVSNATVETYLLEDWMLGVVDDLNSILDYDGDILENCCRVLIYSGQNDIILGPANTELALRKLNWRGQKDFLTATKSVWTDSTADDIAGYVRTARAPTSNASSSDDLDDDDAPVVLTYAVVRGAGHMVPTDQPQRAFDLITTFVSEGGGVPRKPPADGEAVPRPPASLLSSSSSSSSLRSSSKGGAVVEDVF